MLRTACVVLLAIPGYLAADGVIRGRVLDEDTGAVMPCTLTVRTAEGKVLTDHPTFRGGFRIAGEFRKQAPAGKLRVVASRGHDYGAVEQNIELRDGEERELTFRLKRRTPLRSQGWVCGDNHVHMIHGERTIPVDFPFLALSGRAEGLDYLALAQHWNLPKVTPEALDAACRGVSVADFQLWWNMEAPKNYWRGDVAACAGHGWTVGMRGRTPEGADAIQELTAMSAWDYESEKTPFPNFEMTALIHSLGGMVSYSHPHRGRNGKWGGQGIYPVDEHHFISNLAQELPFDTVAGPTYDGIDFQMQTGEREVNRKGLELWFMLLNHGYRIAGTGSSDATFDNPGGGNPGRVRMYTRIEGAVTPERVAEAMKRGRNFVTTGPLLSFTVGGHRVGDVVSLSGTREFKVAVEAWPSGRIGERLSRVEVIRNGQVLRTFEASGQHFRTEFTATENETSWYLARCYGSTQDEVATTNPIYFATASYRAPEPARARVKGTVVDAKTGKPLDGSGEIIRMVGRTPVRESGFTFRNGRFEITVPATARLRVRAAGRQAATRSVFMDYAPLLDSMLKMRSPDLADWATFEKIRSMLQDVSLRFEL